MAGCHPRWRQLRLHIRWRLSGGETRKEETDSRQSHRCVIPRPIDPRPSQFWDF